MACFFIMKIEDQRNQQDQNGQRADQAEDFARPGKNGIQTRAGYDGSSSCKKQQPGSVGKPRNQFAEILRSARQQGSTDIKAGNQEDQSA